MPWARFRLESTEIEQWIVHDAELHRLGFDVDRPRSNPAVGDVDGAGGAASAEPPPAPDGDAAASELVRAREDAWAAIRSHHPNLPDAVIVLGSGVERGRLVKLGHWATGRWVADGQPRGEVLIAGEALDEPPARVFEILLHEAAHALCAARRIPDTSRDGRYHNARFAAVAAEVGLTASPTPPHGLARTTLTPAAEALYAGPLVAWARRCASPAGWKPGAWALAAAPSAVATTRRRLVGRTRSRSLTAAECGCGRKLRIAPTTLAAGPVLCGLCESPFVGVGAAGRSTEAVPRAAPQTPATPHATSLDRQLAPIVERLRARLDAALKPAGLIAGALPQQFTAQLERAARLDALVLRKGPRSIPRPTSSLAERACATATALTSRPFGTGIGGSGPRQRSRCRSPTTRKQLAWFARSLLRADGTIHGPEVYLAGGPFSAGDRVIVTTDDPDRGVPRGTLGTVRNVDPDRGELQVDFATLARLDVAIGEALADRLRHDYVEVTPEPSVPDLSEAALEAEVQRVLGEIEP